MRSTTIVMVVLVAPAALAASDEENRATARARFNEGLDLRNSGDHRGALAKFKAADAAFATPKIRLELAREHIALGELIEAKQVLDSIGTLHLGPKDEPKYEGARAEAAKLAQDVERRIPRLRIVVTNADRVTLDGVVVPTTDLAQARPANPGTHTVVVTRLGKEERRSVTLGEGESTEVRFDDAPSVTTPRAADTRTVPTLSVGLFIASGVGLIAGSAFAWSARSTYQDSQGHCGLGGVSNACDPEGLRLRSSAGSRADVATVSLVVAGAAAAAGVVIWRFSPSAGGQASVSLHPAPAGVSVIGRF